MKQVSSRLAARCREGAVRCSVKGEMLMPLEAGRCVGAEYKELHENHPSESVVRLDACACVAGSIGSWSDSRNRSSQ
jgi:hypothetical protein